MKLGVNIDHVATLRQQRLGEDPDPVEAAKICQRMKVHAIVMHLREDRRHVQDRDLFRVKRAVRLKLNLEMSCAPSIVKVALKLKPRQATLVPERRQELTTEGGLDLFKRARRVRQAIQRLKKRKILVSLFIDPDPRQILRAKAWGADAVELHTGLYADAPSAAQRKREYERLRWATMLAGSVGLTVHAGHGLDYGNVKAITKIRGIEELNIGYAIVVRALWDGYANAVRRMRRLVTK